MEADNALVSTDWVEAHLEDAAVVLVEVDIDTKSYEDGHVPGAVAWNWTTQLQDQVRRDIVSKSDFEALLSQSGIGNGHTVVLYGDNRNWFAAYAFWLLKLYGHADARLMDGGRTKWLAEYRRLTKEAPRREPTHYVAKEPDERFRVTRDYLLEAIGRPDLVLVDVRSLAEYDGTLIAPFAEAEGAQRGGHIPGAVHVAWDLAVRDDGSFEDPAYLRGLYEEKGVTADKEVVTYCRIGERSAFTWFVLTHLLGYPNVRNYDGSWAEWGSLVDVPVEKRARHRPDRDPDEATPSA